MTKMIALCDDVICGTLECEYVDSWNMYGDESCDFRIQIFWFMTIDVLGGAIGIGLLTGQGLPTGGTSRWFPPPSSVTWVSKVNLLQKIYCLLYGMLNCHEWSYEYYEGSILVLYWILTITNSCMSTTKDLLLHHTELKLSRMFIWILRRSYCCVIKSAKLLRIFVWVLWRIYYCIVLNINYHE